MARFTIYSKDGSKERYSGTPKYSGTYLNVAFVEFSNIETPLPIQWEVGDYIDYHRTGKRYKLYSIPEPKKQARPGAYGASFVYSGVKFYEATKELEIALFRDLVPEDNQIHFSTRADVSTYENVYGIASRIQECMDDLYPDRWRIEVYNTSDADLLALFNETKEYSVSNGSCLDALSQIYETWKNVGWVHTYDSVNDKDVITIGKTSIRTEDNTTDAFVYGINNGLTAIKKAALNEGEFATRLYVYGSDRNIQTRHYNSKSIVDAESVNIVNLMIPVDKWGKTNGLPDARKAYIQADDAVIAKYGLIPRIVYFNGSENEEIYPSIKGLTSKEVRSAMIASGELDSMFLPPSTDVRIDQVNMSNTVFGNGTKEEYESKPTFELYLRNVGFDIAERGKLTDEGYATIAMKSGMCAGREFKIKKRKGPLYWEIPAGNFLYEIEREWDESLGMAFPNSIYPIKALDEFVLLDIPMPEYYIALAEEKLYKAGSTLLADYSKVSAFYEPSINPIKIKEGGKLLRQGMYMKVYDEDVIDTKDNTDYVLIDTLTIDETTTIPTYKVTLREQKRAARTFGALEEMIEDVKHTTKEEIAKQRNYTERRFRAAQETLSLLKGVLKNFSDGINPITVETMSLLLGDKSLQYVFTSSTNSLDPIPCPVSFNQDTKQITWTSSALVHLTYGIETITSASGRKASDYHSWYILSDSGRVLEDDEPRYIYARVPEGGGYGTFIDSKDFVDMDAEEGYLHFLVGILNSEYEGTRDFVTLYGFTEILPGQITTDVIKSADGNTYFDLAKGKIVGTIEFGAGSKGLQNVEGFSEFLSGALSGIEVGGQNMLRNSGFTGDYLSEQLADDSVLDATSQMYNPPLVHWDAVNATVQDSTESVSGKEVSVVDGGSLSQTLGQYLIAGEHYALTLKAKGEAFTYNIGGATDEINLSSKWEKYTLDIVPTSHGNEFRLFNITGEICDIQLERGTIPTAWSNNPLDNNSDRAYYEALKHLDNILKPVTEATTTVAGGLVLTNAIHVGNYVDKVLKRATGGMSGTWNNDEDPFLWCGGTMSEANKAIETDGEEGANFVLTHGGKAILNEANVRGTIKATAGEISGFAIEDNWMKADGADYETIVSPARLSTRAKDMQLPSGKYDTLVNMQAYPGAGIPAIHVARIEMTPSREYPEEKAIAIVASAKGANVAEYNPIYPEGEYGGNYAIYSPYGMYAGLRPKCIPLKDGQSYRCTALDHTLISSSAQGTNTIALPENPQDGQVIKIWKNNAHVLKVGTLDGKLITRMNVSSLEVHSIGTEFFGTIELIYHSALGYWLMILHSTM